MDKELIKKYADIKYPLCGDYNTRRYGNDRMNEWLQKSIFNVIELSNGALIALDKPMIETRFCFHDEGLEYDLYKHLNSKEEIMKKYFMNENLKKYDEEIDFLKNGRNDSQFFGFLIEENKTGSTTWRWYNQITDCGFVEEGLKKTRA